MLPVCPTTMAVGLQALLGKVSECWRFNAMSATRAIFMAKKVED